MGVLLGVGGIVAYCLIAGVVHGLATHFHPKQSYYDDRDIANAALALLWPMAPAIFLILGSCWLGEEISYRLDQRAERKKLPQAKVVK